MKTYRELAELLKKEKTDFSEGTIGGMMNTVNEMTGVFPSWDDEAPKWVAEKCVDAILEERETKRRIQEEQIEYKTKKYLVQAIIDEEERYATRLMTESKLIHYIDMDDIHNEKYSIYDVSDFGNVVPIYYVGWQPDCLIQFANEKGEIVLTGYGTDH